MKVEVCTDVYECMYVRSLLHMYQRPLIINVKFSLLKFTWSFNTVLSWETTFRIATQDLNLALFDYEYERNTILC